MENCSHKILEIGINQNTDLTKQMPLLSKATDWTVPLHTGLKRFRKKRKNKCGGLASLKPVWDRSELNRKCSVRAALLITTVYFATSISTQSLKLKPHPLLQPHQDTVSFPLRHEQKQREVHKAEDHASLFLSSSGEPHILHLRQSSTLQGHFLLTGCFSPPPSCRCLKSLINPNYRVCLIQGFDLNATALGGGETSIPKEKLPISRTVLKACPWQPINYISFWQISYIVVISLGGGEGVGWLIGW